MRVFAVGFVVVGLGGALFCLNDIHRSRRAVAWPNAPGVVVASSLVEHEGAFSARVVYDYQVEGKTYRGRDVDPAADGMQSAERRVAHKRLDRYPLKAAVTVYYNPASPDEAMLEPGVRPDSFKKAIFALCFAVAGCVMWVVGSGDKDESNGG